MAGLIETLGNPYTQAVFWLLCVSFSMYLAVTLRNISFGEDTGTRGWTIIAIALFLIGLRVSFKVIFPDYEDSYNLQVLRFSIGILGITLLYIGFFSYKRAIKRIHGSTD